jgi:hypothetical protein
MQNKKPVINCKQSRNKTHYSGCLLYRTFLKSIGKFYLKPGRGGFLLFETPQRVTDCNISGGKWNFFSKRGFYFNKTHLFWDLCRYVSPKRLGFG